MKSKCMLILILAVLLAAVNVSYGYYFRDDFDGSSLGSEWTLEEGNSLVSGGTAIIGGPGTLKFNTELKRHDDFIQVCIKMTSANTSYPAALQLAEILNADPLAEFIFHAGGGNLNPRSLISGGWSQGFVDYPVDEVTFMVLGIMPTATGIDYYVKDGQTPFDPAALPDPNFTGTHTKADMGDNYYYYADTAINTEDFEIDWFQVGDPADPALAIITQHPVSQTVAIGDSAGFGVTATGATGYQWYEGAYPGSIITDGGTISGATTNTLAISQVVSGDVGEYYCVVSNANGDVPSNPADLMTQTPRYYFRDDFEGTSLGADWTEEIATVTVSDANAIVDSGILKFNTELSQYDELIQVCIRMTAANTRYPSALELAATTAADPHAEWVFHDGGGNLNPRSLVGGGWSQGWIAYPVDEQTFMVLGIMPTATGIDYYVKDGKTAFDPTALPTPDFTGGHTKAELGDYYCRFITDDLYAEQSFELSWFQVGDPDVQPPIITAQPISRTVAQGNMVNFSVTATGAVSYQWRKNEVIALANGGNISGATTDTLTIVPVGSGDYATYCCNITNADGSTLSKSAILAEPDMVAHYKFDDGSTVAYDSSGYGNHLDLQGASPSWVTGGTELPGLDGKSLSFNGTDDECFINVTADGIPVDGLPYTFELWVNIDASEFESSRYLVYFDYGPEASNFNAMFSAMHGEAFGTDIYNAAWPNAVRHLTDDPSTADIVDNWVHIACSYDQSDMKMYINGSLRATETPSGMYTADDADNFAIGGSQVRANLFHGLMDDVKVYNYARTGIQIAEAVAEATEEPVCLKNLTMDSDNDCDVDLVDFAVLAGEWLVDDFVQDPTP